MGFAGDRTLEAVRFHLSEKPVLGHVNKAATLIERLDDLSLIENRTDNFRIIDPQEMHFAVRSIMYG
jgi:hypothetical protein